MHELHSGDVIFAIKDEINYRIPEIDIRRWRSNITQEEMQAFIKEQRGNPFIFDTRTLNVFTDRDSFDPNDKDIYPYIFIRQFAIGGREHQRKGKAERYTYDYNFALAFYIDINPNNLSSVPRINEELRDIELRLTRVLRYLEIWDNSVEVFFTPPSNIAEGILHLFLNIPVYEDTIPVKHNKMESIVQNIQMGELKYE